MESELGSLITTLGVPLGIIIWIAIGIISLVNKQAPAVIKRYQDQWADSEEHAQSLEDQKLKHRLRREELLALTEAGNRTYTEEQLTHHLSEVYVEFQAVNLFIREVVQVRLREIEKKLDLALLNVGDLAVMKERLAEVRMYTRAIYNYLEADDEKIMAETSSSDELDGIDVEVGVEPSIDEVSC